MGAVSDFSERAVLDFIKDRQYVKVYRICESLEIETNHGNKIRIGRLLCKLGWKHISRQWWEKVGGGAK